MNQLRVVQRPLRADGECLEVAVSQFCVLPTRDLVPFSPLNSEN